MNMIKNFHKALDNGFVKEVFDHIKNFLYAALFLAAGSYSMQNESTAWFGLYYSEGIGIGAIAFGIGLMILNLYYGTYNIIKSNHSPLWSVLIVSVYILVSLRIVEVIWNFRFVR